MLPGCCLGRSVWLLSVLPSCLVLAAVWAWVGLLASWPMVAVLGGVVGRLPTAAWLPHWRAWLAGYGWVPR